MLFLDQNIKGLCGRFGVDFYQLLKDFDVDNVTELSILDLEAIAEEYEGKSNHLPSDIPGKKGLAIITPTPVSAFDQFVSKIFRCILWQFTR
jgi:hypothetical protein